MAHKKRSTHHLTTGWSRAMAWLHFYLKDHHVLRVWWWNMAEIAPGVWRSNQPSPGRLRRCKALGIKNVVSLRGDMRQSFNVLPQQACADLGMGYQNIPGLVARGLRTAETILAVMDELASVPKPMVFHCKSGADRTGFAAALYLILYEGRPVAEAAEQLAAKHIHFKRSGSGVLDHVFRVYLRDIEPTGQGFRDWLETGYDPKAIRADFNDWRAGAKRWAK